MLLFFILNKRCIWKKLPGIAYVKNYYDGYSFIGTTGFTNERFTSGDTHGRGKLTGSVVSIPDTNLKIYKAFYYDTKGRMVKSVESNLMAGFNVVNTTYSFTDKPLVVTRTHNGGAGFSMSETYTYSYDHADRLIKTEHTLNGSTITMAEYTYDNLGRMFSKRLHGKEAFRTDYTYNIRNWLTGISGDLFTQNLHYTDGVGTACYNGNISSMTWQSGDETTVRGYKYTYDGLNRMKNGTYGEGSTLAANVNRYSETISNYDKNGNIGGGYIRWGRLTDGSYGIFNALGLTYNGNQLKFAIDAGSYHPYEGAFEFKDGASASVEYFYDANGNLTQDLNKGISNISYNVLSLPSVVTFTDGSTITYYYDAEGNKVRVIYNITGETSLQRNYSNGVIYDNGRQQCLFTDEGYIDLTDSNKYYYYLKDHQGNNRVVVDEDENIVEVNHYYPFGGVFEPTGDVQRYKYNGKEYIADGELNWYDYGVRHYDPAIGRFTTMDPLAEKYYSTSPYAYCLDNPVKYVDPTGCFASTHTDSLGNVIAVFNDGDLGVYRHDTDANSVEQLLANDYSTSNTSAGGERMGETYEWDSFVNPESKDPIGKIEFGSFVASRKVFSSLRTLTKIAPNSVRLLIYALNANNGEMFDVKSGNPYFGSQFGVKKYVSMRDAGNILAGMLARSSGLSANVTYTAFGALQLSGNNRALLPLYLYKAWNMRTNGNYGETPISHSFQKRGYELNF